MKQLQTKVTGLSQEDNNCYQNKIFGSLNSDVFQKHLKKIQQKLKLPTQMVSW